MGANNSERRKRKREREESRSYYDFFRIFFLFPTSSLARDENATLTFLFAQLLFVFSRKGR